MYSIEELFLFNGLEKAQINEIISLLDAPISFDKGTEIYNGSSFTKAIGIILSGKAEAFDEVLLKKSFVQGDIFGVAALYSDEQEYISRIVAASQCKIQFICEDMLNNIFKTYPITASNYIAFLSGRIRFLNKKIKLFTCKGVSAKLYQFLSENADESNAVEISNMSRLAKMTSIGRTSLYRAVEELTESGMIEKFGSKFIIK